MNKIIKQARTAKLLFALCLLLPVGVQAQTVQKWDGPNKDSLGWDYWKGTMTDGSTFWAWDNSQGERKFAFDANNDGRYESWQEEFSIPSKPVLLVHHWDNNQDNKDDGISWAEGGIWIEKVWDSNNDGLMDSWCRYDNATCVQYKAAPKNSINLTEKKNALDTATREYQESKTRNSAAQKRATAQFNRAEIIYSICKNMK